MVTGTVRAIEYQGSWVKVTIEGASPEDFVVNLPDTEYFRDVLGLHGSSRDHHAPRKNLFCFCLFDVKPAANVQGGSSAVNGVTLHCHIWAYSFYPGVSVRLGNGSVSEISRTIFSRKARAKSARLFAACAKAPKPPIMVRS